MLYFATTTTTNTPNELVQTIIKNEYEEKINLPQSVFNDIDAPNNGDKYGRYNNVVERDYGDFGNVSPMDTIIIEIGMLTARKKTR